MGSRLAKFIQREQRLTINAIHLWTDSTTVLQWIYGSHQRQQVFVANRVAEILENTQAHQWNHCPGEWNPADDGTRGIPFRDFHYSSRWFQGLAFLKKPASDWPLNPAHPQGCAKVSASFSSAGPTTQVNSYPGIEFAQEETTAAEVATEEEDTTAAEVATEEEDTTAAEVATEEETTAAEVATEEEETTATEVAKSDEGKPGATKATVVATVSLLPKTTACITVPAHCDTNTVNETLFSQLPSSIMPLYRDISNTLRVDRFSSWKKLVRVTAYVLRAIANFKKRRRPQPPSVTKQDKLCTTPRSNPPSPFRSLSLPHAIPFLSANEMSASKRFLLRSSQHECFANEIKSFSNRQRISSKSRLLRLKPFLDSTQTLRAEGRLRKSPFDYCLKHPMILDGQHRIVQLFVAFIHNSNCHTRLKQTQHILQLEFWILNAGSIIKKIIRRCYGCRRQDAYATYPEMSDLPPYRFPADQPFPFQQTGLDVFGPFANLRQTLRFDFNLPNHSSSTHRNVP